MAHAGLPRSASTVDASMEVRLLREEDWDGRPSCL